jgi:hypothetical protein
VSAPTIRLPSGSVGIWVLGAVSACDGFPAIRPFALGTWW